MHIQDIQDVFFYILITLFVSRLAYFTIVDWLEERKRKDQRGR